MVRTLEAAAAWVDEVGLALLFPKADVVLPSLWEQVNGSPADNYALRDADGNFVRWSDELSFLWGAKDDLPAAGLVCVGKHLARVTTCVSPRLLPHVVAAAEPFEASAEEQVLIDAIASEGPLTGPQLRDLTGLTKKEVDRTVAALHRRLVLTNSHLVEQDGPWGAIAHCSPASGASGRCRNVTRPGASWPRSSSRQRASSRRPISEAPSGGRARPPRRRSTRLRQAATPTASASGRASRLAL